MVLSQDHVWTLLSPTSYALIGILTSICGNILISIALNVQRYAHRLLQRNNAVHLDSPLQFQDNTNNIDHHENNSYLKSKWWWLGMSLMSAGELGNFLAYGFAPASVVSPLGVVAMISNCIIAPTFFDEKIKFSEIFGVFLSVVGILCIVLSSPGNGDIPNGSPTDWIFSRLNDFSFKIYLISTVLFLSILIHILNKNYYGRNLSDWRNYSKKSKFIYLLSTLIVVSLFGGYTALSTKAISMLISFDLLPSLKNPIFYILVLIALITAIFQIKYLNKALQLFDSTQVIPLQFVLFTISVMFGSAIIYHDFENQSKKQIIRFIFGCLFTFCGVYMISAFHQSSESNHTPSSASVHHSIDFTNDHLQSNETRYRSGSISGSNIATRQNLDEEGPRSRTSSIAVSIRRPREDDNHSLSTHLLDSRLKKLRSSRSEVNEIIPESVSTSSLQSSLPAANITHSNESTPLLINSNNTSASKITTNSRSRPKAGSLISSSLNLTRWKSNTESPQRNKPSQYRSRSYTDTLPTTVSYTHHKNESITDPPMVLVLGGNGLFTGSVIYAKGLSRYSSEIDLSKYQDKNLPKNKQQNSNGAIGEEPLGISRVEINTTIGNIEEDES